MYYEIEGSKSVQIHSRINIQIPISKLRVFESATNMEMDSDSALPVHVAEATQATRQVERTCIGDEAVLSVVSQILLDKRFMPDSWPKTLASKSSNRQSTC